MNEFGDLPCQGSRAWGFAVSEIYDFGGVEFRRHPTNVWSRGIIISEILGFGGLGPQVTGISRPKGSASQGIRVSVIRAFEWGCVLHPSVSIVCIKLQIKQRHTRFVPLRRIHAVKALRLFRAKCYRLQLSKGIFGADFVAGDGLIATYTIYIYNRCQCTSCGRGHALFDAACLSLQIP